MHLLADFQVFCAGKPGNLWSSESCRGSPVDATSNSIGGTEEESEPGER